MIRNWHRYAATYALGLLTAIGCASTPTFPWNYYSAQMPAQCYQSGVLLGKNDAQGSWPDIPLTTCEPDPVPTPSSSVTPILLKCITVKVDDFYSIRQDDIDTHSNLQTCQASLAQCKSAIANQ